MHVHMQLLQHINQQMSLELQAGHCYMNIQACIETQCCQHFPPVLVV